MPRSFGTPRRRGLPVAATGLALALGLAACSGSDAATGSDPASGTPIRGGTLSIDVASTPLCLDPQNNNSNGNTAISRGLVDSLTDQDPATGKAVPWLASSFTVNANATEFTFTLRPHATFSDGSPVDAAAVKANFDSIVRLGATDAVGSSYLAGYTGTTVVGPLVARVTFSAPNAQFLQATSTAALGLLSPASLAATPQQRCQGQDLYGSGPFTLASQTPSEIRLVRRADYDWGSSLWHHQGAAYLAGIDYDVVPEDSVRTGGLASGQVDGVIGVEATDQKTLGSAGLDWLVRAVPGVTFNMTANTTHPIVSDPLVRQAIELGVNRSQIVSTLLSSSYKPATSILSSSTPGYADLSADLAYDPTKAETLLQGDGWTVGSGGIRVKNGKRLQVQVIYPGVDTASAQVLQLVQQQLAQIGVDLVLDGLPLNQLAPDQNAGDYDLLWFSLTRADPDILRTVYSVTQKDRAYLPTGNPLETLLDEQAATENPTTRQALVASAQKLIVQQAYSIPIYEAAQVDGFAASVHGAALDASAQPELFDAWLSS
jgi:peptide/nickel transport system substrate-binding protein